MYEINVRPNARWKQNGITIAGGNGQGNEINQLSNPLGLYVDDDENVYVADQSNHRIVKWNSGATSGQVVAGGNQQGSGAHQLYDPFDVIIDKERDSLIQGGKSGIRNPGITWDPIESRRIQRNLKESKGIQI